ncbi:MAG TPA: GNAT family N-acetyltransferase [Parvularculaceae bacterium]|nr:GNAT family N-acetyltransferase [Parvularculaceae bacterium]
MYVIKVHHAGACPEELYAFRYRIYVEEMNRPQRYACHETRTIRDGLDDMGHQCVAYYDGEIVACIRGNSAREWGVGEYFEFYELDQLSPNRLAETCVCTRLMVAREHRHRTLTVDLLKALYRHGLETGHSLCYMDCNRHLEVFFRKFGYRPLFNKNHYDYGDVSVMRLDMTDMTKLKTVGSPFAEELADFMSARPILGAAARA